MTQIMRDIAFKIFAVSNFQKVRKCSKNGLNQGFFEVAFLVHLFPLAYEFFPTVTFRLILG